MCQLHRKTRGPLTCPSSAPVQIVTVQLRSAGKVRLAMRPNRSGQVLPSAVKPSISTRGFGPRVRVQSLTTLSVKLVSIWPTVYLE